MEWQTECIGGLCICFHGKNGRRAAKRHEVFGSYQSGSVLSERIGWANFIQRRWTQLICSDKKTHSDSHTFAWAEVEQNEKSFSGVRLNLKFDLEDHLKWRLLFLNMCLRFDGQGTFAWLWSPKHFFTCWTKVLMNSQMLPSKDRGILEQHGTTVLYVLFLCQVTQKLKEMDNSISDLNETVIDSPEGSKHCALCIARSKDV